MNSGFVARAILSFGGTRSPLQHIAPWPVGPRPQYAHRVRPSAPVRATVRVSRCTVVSARWVARGVSGLFSRSAADGFCGFGHGTRVLPIWHLHRMQIQNRPLGNHSWPRSSLIVPLSVRQPFGPVRTCFFPVVGASLLPGLMFRRSLCPCNREYRWFVVADATRFRVRRRAFPAVVGSLSCDGRRVDSGSEVMVPVRSCGV